MEIKNHHNKNSDIFALYIFGLNVFERRKTIMNDFANMRTFFSHLVREAAKKKIFF